MILKRAKALIIFIPSLFFLFHSFEVQAQNPDTILLRKTYTHEPFISFAGDLEREYGIRLFYEKDWVKNVFVDISQKGVSITDAIRRIVSKYSFTYEVFDGTDFILIPADHNGQSAKNGGISGVVGIGNPAEKGRYKTAEINGQVLEGETGMPIPGAIIYIEDTKEGTTTGKDGKYSLKVSTGEHSIRYSFIGLEEKKQQVIVYENGSLNMELFEKSFALEEVVVKETRRDQNVSAMEMGKIRLDAKSLQKLPVLMGETDIIKSLTLLPGVVSTGEGSSGFNVRGGNSDQNLILMDDATIYNASHLFGMFSVINPDAIKDVSLMKGDIPASFGGRTSSVMNIAMKNGNYKTFHVSGGIGPLNSKLMIDGPFANKKGSFLFSARTTYSDWILQQLPDINLRNSKANFYDLNGKINFYLGENDHINLMGYASKDKFNFAGTTQYEYANSLFSANWNHYFSVNYFSNIVASYSRYDFSLSNPSDSVQAFIMNSVLEDYSVKSSLKFSLAEKHKLEAGIDLTYYMFTPGNYEALGSKSLIKPEYLNKENAAMAAFYFSDNWSITSTISLSIGLRFSNFLNLGPSEVYKYASDQTMSELSIVDTLHYSKGQVVKYYHGFEPRLGLKIGINDESSVKISYNRNVQYLHLLSNSSAIAPTDMWTPSGTYLKPDISNQFSVGYYRNFFQNTFETSVEAYYKKYDNLVDYKNGASLFMNKLLETSLLNGNGMAYGIEFLVKKTMGKLTGWGGYTYSRSLIRTSGKFPDETINNGDYYPTFYDKPNDLTIAMNYQLTRRWRVSGNFLYSTGRPATYPETSYPYNGSELVYYSDRNKYRLPDYHRLDLSVSIDGNLKKYKRWKSSWTFSVINVYGRKNVFSAFYAKDTPSAANDYRIFSLYKLAIIGRPFPSLTFNFNF
jgi:hypothetical protein